MQKIGLLGGTFDPIHNGHLSIANHALKKFNLSQVEFIPCFQPPHRHQPIANALDRFRMVQLAVQHHPHLSVNDIEIQRGNISYSVDTIKSLQQQFPNHEYYFIVGADAFSKFDTWRDWEIICSNVNIIVVNRSNEKIILPKKVADFTGKKRIDFLTIQPIAISATQIRLDIALKKENVNGLDNTVWRYIVEKKIYH